MILVRHPSIYLLSFLLGKYLLCAVVLFQPLEFLTACVCLSGPPQTPRVPFKVKMVSYKWPPKRDKRGHNVGPGSRGTGRTMVYKPPYVHMSVCPYRILITIHFNSFVPHIILFKTYLRNNRMWEGE